MDSEHCEIVGKSLSGRRSVDEHTFDSLEVLTERLERLKKLGAVFSAISFSPDIKKLASNKKAVVLC